MPRLMPSSQVTPWGTFSRIVAGLWFTAIMLSMTGCQSMVEGYYGALISPLNGGRAPSSSSPSQRYSSSSSQIYEGIRKAAEQGDAHAQFRMGHCYAEGIYTAKDDVQAAAWYRKAAEQGLEVAQYVLGGCYAEGKGVAKDFVQAVKWWRKADEQGAGMATYYLGCCYANGEGVARDLVEAYAYLIQVKWGEARRKLATLEMEMTPEQIVAGQKRSKGLQNEIATKIRMAADQGDADAQYRMGHCYAEGIYTAKDDVQAAAWYRKAAEQGLEVAQYVLGGCYAEGKGVAKDFVQAVKWWRKADEQGAGMATYYLGCCYANGEGVARDLVEAYAYLIQVKWGEARRKLATLEMEMTPEQIVAGQKRSKGLQNEIATKIRMAADQGDADAQYRMGHRYAIGDGAEINLVESLKWYRQAAENGQVEAQYRLGFIYEQGRGVPVDYVEAARWWRRAADQGHAGAQYNLGVCYRRGEGVAKDSIEALKWYRKAADQGYAKAQYNLGLCYANGDGVRRDEIEAYAYLNLAMNDENARQYLGRLKKTMFPDSISRGEKRTGELQDEMHARRAGKEALR